MVTVTLDRPSPQLIFAPEVQRLERHLFSRAPLYLGHTHPTPEGYLRVPPWAKDIYLSCAPGSEHVGVRSNVCLHWQADILEPQTESGFLPFAKSLLCKSHNAVYASDTGRLLNGQIFQQACEHHLPEIPVLRWNGFLFRDAQWEGLPGSFSLADELAVIDRETQGLITANGYTLAKTIVMEQAGNWALFMLNYLDLMHVAPAHPETLNQLCDCSMVTSFPALEFATERDVPGRWSSVQTVGAKASWGSGATADWDDLNNPQRGKAAFHLWGQMYKAIKGNPPVGSIWTTTFPQLMFEWYPGVIVASQVFPHASDPTRCWVYHDFYYDQELLAAYPNFIDVHQVAFHTTGDEDEWMVGSTSRNLYKMALRGIDRPTGFVHPQLEDCAPMYHARLQEVWHDLQQR